MINRIVSEKLKAPYKLIIAQLFFQITAGIWKKFDNRRALVGGRMKNLEQMIIELPEIIAKLHYGGIIFNFSYLFSLPSIFLALILTTTLIPKKPSLHSLQYEAKS